MFANFWTISRLDLEFKNVIFFQPKQKIANSYCPVCDLVSICDLFGTFLTIPLSYISPLLCNLKFV